MKPKLLFNPDKTKFISSHMNDVFIACGYDLMEQKKDCVSYKASDKQLVIILSERFEVRYSKDLGPKFFFSLSEKIDEVAILDILNSAGAISYFSLDIAKDAVREAMNKIRKQSPKPLTEDERKAQFKTWLR